MIDLVALKSTLKHWRLIAVIIALVLAVLAGIWFRGVLADNERLTTQNGAQAAEITNLNEEVERMSRQDAADFALFTRAEEQKQAAARSLQEKILELRKAKEQLDVATRNCFDLVLPDDYLDRLP